MPDYELKDCIAQWKSASATQWGRLTLSRDPLIHLFSEDQKTYVVTAALECGHAKADEFLQKYGSAADPLRIAADMGIKISSHDYPIGENKHILFAQYENHEITYAKGIVDKINLLMEKEDLRPLLDQFNPIAAILTHELYHCIEDENPTILTRKMKIPLKIWKVFTQNATPIMAGEIGAFAFSQTLTGLTFHPRIVEMLGIWCFNRELAKALTANLLSFPQ